MADANVQRALVTDFGAGEDTVDVTINAVDWTSTTNSQAFARITNLGWRSGGVTAGSAGRNNDDASCTCLLTADTTVTLTRPATGADEDNSIAFEVIEFPATGDNAAIVRFHDNITTSSGTNTTDTAITVGTLANCVPIICGISSTCTTQALDRMVAEVSVVNATGDKIRIYRGDAAFDVTYSIAVIEFTGANWTVQNNITHDFTTEDTVETETVDAVTWANTMIFSSHSSSQAGIESNHVAVWPGATTTALRFECGDDTSDATAHLVSNANLDVEHIGSLTGLGSPTGIIDSDGSSPSVSDHTITASTLADHFVVCNSFKADNTAGDITTTAWNYYLTSTTNLRFTAGRGNNPQGDLDWAGQLIDVSGLTEAGVSIPIFFHHYTKNLA